MKYLIDTCVISELIKINPDPSCITWIRSHHESSFYISVLTIGELRKGISKLKPSKKRIQLEHWFEEEFIPRFQLRIISIDEAVAMKWGELLARCESAGRSLPTIGSLIAATAAIHSFAIVTRNVKDFNDLDVEIVNPWNSP